MLFFFKEIMWIEHQDMLDDHVDGLLEMLRLSRVNSKLTDVGLLNQILFLLGKSLRKCVFK